MHPHRRKQRNKKSFYTLCFRDSIFHEGVHSFDRRSRILAEDEICRCFTIHFDFKESN